MPITSSLVNISTARWRDTHSTRSPIGPCWKLLGPRLSVSSDADVARPSPLPRAVEDADGKLALLFSARLEACRVPLAAQRLRLPPNSRGCGHGFRVASVALRS